MVVFYMQISSGTVFPEESNQISYKFFPISDITLEQISSGKVGEGYLLYYLPESGFKKPGIIVHLIRRNNSSDALAEVYAAPPGENHLSIKFVNRLPQVADLPVSVIIHAKSGWWTRNGLPNYNLDIQINGPIQATWGGDMFTHFINVGEPAVNIKVRDTNADGIPDWDLRNVLPLFPGQGFIRSNYAERKCDSPAAIDYGMSPLWPYISPTGGYEQTNASFRGPIVVDLKSGKINYFSELVTVRNQNCGYSFYALEPITQSRTNLPNFESPFAIYDLSGQGEGYPNLVIRAERYPAGDPWMQGLDRDYEIIRYSWRDEIGDLKWDYKLEVLGFHPYASFTGIASGLASVDVPPYEFLPHWVIEKSWPVVTFVDAEGLKDHSSEGIYEWSPREMGDSYFLGQASLPNPEAFSGISEGYRGEYRSDRNIPPELYLSPIDWRLHLRGAQAGLFNLGAGAYLREVNLDGGYFINGWIRLRNPTGLDLGNAQEISSSEIEEALYAFDDFLLYINPEGIELRKTSFEPEFLRINPPSDHETWHIFRQRIDPYTSRRKDPNDIYHWLDEFPGQRIWISGANIEQVRKTPAGFRCILELKPGFDVSDSQGSGFSNLLPGKYLVEYSGKFKISPLTPPSIEIKIVPSSDPIIVHKSSLIRVKLTNLGLEDMVSAMLVLQASNRGEIDTIDRLPFSLMSGEAVSLSAGWQPQNSGPWLLEARLESPDGSKLYRSKLLVIVEGEQDSLRGIRFLLSDGGVRYGFVASLLCFAMMIIMAILVASRLG